MARIAGAQIGLMGRELKRSSGLQTFYYRIATVTTANGDVIVLDYIPHAVKAYRTRVYVTATDADMTATLGHYTDDGSAATVVDADSIASGIAFSGAGPTEYMPPVATAGTVIPGGTVTDGATTAHALCLTLTNDGTAWSGLVAVTVEPVA